MYLSQDDTHTQLTYGYVIPYMYVELLPKVLIWWFDKFLLTHQI